MTKWLLGCWRLVITVMLGAMQPLKAPPSHQLHMDQSNYAIIGVGCRIKPHARARVEADVEMIRRHHVDFPDAGRVYSWIKRCRFPQETALVDRHGGGKREQLSEEYHIQEPLSWFLHAAKWSR